MGFQDLKVLSLNADQKYCKMLQGEHSAILSNFIKVPYVINTFVLFIFEWSLKTGFTVLIITSLFFISGLQYNTHEPRIRLLFL